MNHNCLIATLILCAIFTQPEVSRTYLGREGKKMVSSVVGISSYWNFVSFSAFFLPLDQKCGLSPYQGRLFAAHPDRWSEEPIILEHKRIPTMAN